jgi:hypothetical protein
MVLQDHVGQHLCSRLVFRMWFVQILARTPAILTGFPQFLLVKTEIAPWLGYVHFLHNPFQFVNHPSIWHYIHYIYSSDTDSIARYHTAKVHPAQTRNTHWKFYALIILFNRLQWSVSEFKILKVVYLPHSLPFCHARKLSKSPCLQRHTSHSTRHSPDTSNMINND